MSEQLLFTFFSVPIDMLHILPTRGDHTLTHNEVAELQAMICKQNQGKTPKDSLAAKAQSVIDRHANEETADPIITKLFEHYGVRVISKGLARKIASTAAKTNQGRIKKDSFAARVQSAADTNEYLRAKGQKTEEELVTMLEVRRPHPITKQFAKSLQSTEANLHHGKVSKGSEAALAQSAVDKMEHMERLRSMSSSMDTLDSSKSSTKKKKRGSRKKKSGSMASKSISISRSVSSGAVESDED